MITETMKACTKCKTVTVATDEYFSPDKRNRDGLASRCKACERLRSKERSQSEGTKASQKKYRQTIRGKESHQRYYQTINGRLRTIFSNAKRRCTDPKSVGFKRYGGRGIEVRFESADEFVDYVMNDLQADPAGLEIDRIDNNGHYERGNIRFVTSKENANNRG